MLWDQKGVVIFQSQELVFLTQQVVKCLKQWLKHALALDSVIGTVSMDSTHICLYYLASTLCILMRELWLLTHFTGEEIKAQVLAASPYVTKFTSSRSKV